MLGILVSAIIASGPIVTYDELMTMAINECPHAYWESVNEEILENLVEIEEHYFEQHSIPKGLRGMLLAAACMESGYNPKANGDWTINKQGKSYPRAKGIVQLWPWWSKKYKIDRYNIDEAADIWMKHIIKQRYKVEKLHWCPRNFSNERKWVVAWVQTTRGISTQANKYRCFQKPAHHKLLKKWHRLIKAHQHNNGCDC